MNKPLVFRLFPLSIAAFTLTLAACIGSSTDSDDQDPLTDMVPVITAQPRDTAVVEGSLAMFTVEATGAVTYKWVRNDTDTLEGEVLPILVLTDVSLDDDGDRFKCVVGNFKGTVVSASAELEVSQGSGSPDTVVTRAELLEMGSTVYTNNCSGCHGSYGEGGGAPPHANSDFFMNNRESVIRIVLQGNMDSVIVNGRKWDGGSMPAFGDFLSDTAIASVITFIRVVMNDSLVTNCDPANLDGEGHPICQKTARTPADIAADSVSVQEVRAVRDTLTPLF